jgi:hypothetical protein
MMSLQCPPPVDTTAYEPLSATVTYKERTLASRWPTKKFCEDNNGKTIEDKTGLERKYQRHAVSSYGVEDRASYWVSASFIKGCHGKVTIKKAMCIEKFSKGLDFSHNLGSFSFGSSAAEQCVEYAIDTGFELRDDGGP